MTMAITTTGSAAWSEQSYEDALQIIAAGLTELVGFGMAVICVRRGDDLVAVAVSGEDDTEWTPGVPATRESMLGTRWPLGHILDLLAAADDWGRFKFVPHDRVQRSAWAWVRESVAVEGEDAWHPNDGAIAPIFDATGELVAVISVDDPATGRHPDAAQRRVMDKYATEAANVVLSAIEREALERRLELALAARQVVRTASRHLSLDALLDETGPAFLDAFAVSGLWLRVRGSSETMLWGMRRTEPSASVPAANLVVDLDGAAQALWERRTAAIVYGDGRSENVVLDAEAGAAARAALQAGGLGSVLHAPIGAGTECLGSLLLARDPGQPDWSAAEAEQAAEVARDLGRIIRNGQVYARAQELVRDLRELDAHKSQLIAMISHELKNPLTVLLANRDLLEPELDGDPDALVRLADIDANAQRMGRVVDNLLLLSKLADPDTPMARQDVDLKVLLADVEAAYAASMGQRGLTLHLSVPHEPVVITGDAAELRTMLANVIGNGIKFSDDGADVEVTVTRGDEAVDVVVVDHGIGMSAEDQGRLFTDFFRSDDPAARARPGCGLGLPIVDRILRRHGGRAEVTSELRRGTTFRIVLPTLAVPAVPGGPPPS
jgi:signal transduction histidine kinase